MAIITVRNRAINLDAAEIPNLDASKITTGNFDASRIGSGTFADARIAASNVSQHATSFDDNKIVNDISTLGLRVHTQENLTASNTSSASFDTFQDSSAITNLTNAVRNSAEYMTTNAQTITDQGYLTGNQNSNFTVTTNGNWEVTPQTFLTNGNMGYENTNITLTNGYSQSAGVYVRFDRGSGNSTIFTGMKFTRQSGATQGGGSTWQWRGSNNLSSYTTLLDNQQWGGSNPTEYSWTNDTAYRYLEFYNPNSFTSNHSSYEYEWQVRYGTASGTFHASGSFEGNSITASSTNKMGAVITYQDYSGTNALNTDIILKLSADNGSNYSTATLTALPDFATGIKMAKVNDLSVTAGTQLKYKIEFANQSSGSKEARIRGVSLQY